ncbi:MAG TPA: zinc ribbon domain-containing protein [Xanthomonadaceae bacterium]|nr:zinc ribbon domain-containing protein [Xanthomonadaceae bacterium]
MSTCPNCGASASDDAIVCPECQAEIGPHTMPASRPSYEPQQFANVVGGVVLVGAVALFILLLSRCSGTTQQSTTRPSSTVPNAAVQACRDRVRSNANHPSTVSFATFGQSTDAGGPGGGYRVRLDFTAKNSFGLELKFQALCVFAPGSSSRMVDFGAWER